MSLFEKLGLVERDYGEMPITADVVAPVTAQDAVDVEITSTENVVGEIYAQNDLAKETTSIYSVQKYMDTLPEEMPTATKQKTIAGILMVAQQSIPALIADANKRMDILRAARDKIVAERNDEIAAAERDIESMKQAIEAASIQIKNDREVIASTSKSVDDEIKLMESLVEFCNGMEAK